MKLEDQVCSLSLAKRLKELGVKQESQFYWRCNVDFKTQVLRRHDQVFPHAPDYEGLASEEYPSKSYAAFTVAELGEMLPTWVGTMRIGGEIEKWMGSLERLPGNMEPFRHFISDTEADARAKMLIHLIENKLVTTKETTPND